MEAIEAARRRLSESATVKLVVLAFLVLVLLIPLARIAWLVEERARRLETVGLEMAATWGEAQTVTGPVLAVPYRYEAPSERIVEDPARPASRQIVAATQLLTGTAYYLPQEIRWTGEIEPEVRYRGIFEVIVYRARLRAEGFFRAPELACCGVEAEEVLWSEASLTVGLSDPKGLDERVSVVWEGAEVPFAPGTGGVDAVAAGIHAPELLGGEPPAPGGRLPFSFEMVLRGTGDLRFFPAGEETRVELRSPWPSPSFSGAYLPSEREVGPTGFTASWRVPHLGRNTPQAWLAGEVAAQRLEASAFGVALLLPADGYQKTERSIKYGVLFLLLTFVTFFLLELVSPVRLHAVNYLLVGAALCLFYLLLLSLSEHLGFAPAYGLGAGACTLLIAGYGRAVLASGRWAAVLGASLGVLYGYLYVLLQAEDYALLLGAVGLFVILALVMYLTRRLEWRSLRFEGSERQGGA